MSNTSSIFRGGSLQKYKKIKRLNPEEFRRLTGIKQETFKEIIVVLREEELRRKTKGNRHRLCIEDRLLMALEYLREYRTYFHLGQSYGLSESACFRACRWVEDTLIKNGKFSLPGRKALLKSGTEYEVLLIDATESPVERPKKKGSK